MDNGAEKRKYNREYKRKQRMNPEFRKKERDRERERERVLSKDPAWRARRAEIMRRYYQRKKALRQEKAAV